MTNNYIIAILAAFTVGCIVGVLGERYNAKNRYETELDDGVYDHDVPVAKPVDKRQEYARNREEYMEIARDYGGTKRFAVKRSEEREIEEERSMVRLPFQLGEEGLDLENATTTTITYYQQDGVLTDERFDPIEEPEDIVGEFVWKKLPQELSDVIYIQNDRLDCIYEVLIEHGLSYHEEFFYKDE